MHKNVMKTIEQLLFLSKNPYYKLRPEEQEVLDDFLLKKQEEDSQKSQKKSSKKIYISLHKWIGNIRHLPRSERKAQNSPQRFASANLQETLKENDEFSAVFSWR